MFHWDLDCCPHPRPSVCFIARAAAIAVAALAKNLPTSLTRNEFTDGRVLTVKDRRVLYEIQDGCKRVLQFRHEPGRRVKTRPQAGAPETCDFRCGRESRLTPTPIRREPSLRETSQDSGLGERASRRAKLLRFLAHHASARGEPLTRVCLLERSRLTSYSSIKQSPW